MRNAAGVLFESPGYTQDKETSETLFGGPPDIYRKPMPIPLPQITLTPEWAPAPSVDIPVPENVKERLALAHQMMDAAKAGDYATAYSLAQQVEAKVEADEMKDWGALGKLTGGALSNVSWFALMTHNFAAALDASERAIQLLPNNLLPVANQAHALMFLGRTAAAKSIYS